MPHVARLALIHLARLAPFARANAQPPPAEGAKVLHLYGVGAPAR